MYAVTPGVSESSDLFWFSRDPFWLVIFRVPAGSTPLEVAVEFDTVGGVDVDALDLTA